MTPEMQRALIDLSTYFDPDPTRIFRRVLEVVSEFYGRTMAMINLLGEGHLRYYANVNPHPLLRRTRTQALRHTY